MHFNAPDGFRIDWKTEPERIDLAALATNVLGPAPGRRGEGGRRLWWNCPFHDDPNPSFCVIPGKDRWSCFGCGRSGDAIDLVVRLRGATFPEAAAFLTRGSMREKPGKTYARPATRSSPGHPPLPSGLPEADALSLVESGEACLWSPVGKGALAYLTGPRCLAPKTIRAARLGWTPGVSIPTRDGDRSFHARGWVIPWVVGPRLAMVKLRQPDGRRPKYVEAFRDPSRLVCYPGPATIRPGRPLIVTEGELDALCLGEALGEMAAVVTQGSASARPDPRSLGVMLASPRWFIATDADPAGDKAADGWPARARRVRPPGAFKDWTEVRRAGVDLHRWWTDVLAGVDQPPLFTWNEVNKWRWGPAVDDPTPGIDNPGRRPRLEMFAPALATDPYALAEREAIRAKSGL